MASWLKRKLTAATASRSFAQFVGLLETFGDRRANLLRVLTYHRVDEPDARPNLYPGLISATPVEFAAQMEYLSSRYRVIHMADALDAVCGNGDLPPRAVLITFAGSENSAGFSVSAAAHSSASPPRRAPGCCLALAAVAEKANALRSSSVSTFANFCWPLHSSASWQSETSVQCNGYAASTKHNTRAARRT